MVEMGDGVDKTWWRGGEIGNEGKFMAWQGKGCVPGFFGRERPWERDRGRLQKRIQHKSGP